MKAVRNNETYYPIVDQKIPFKFGKSKHMHIAWYKMDKMFQKGNIRIEAEKWLTELRKTVSGNPRVYLDNTLDVMNADLQNE